MLDPNGNGDLRCGVPLPWANHPATLRSWPPLAAFKKRDFPQESRIELQVRQDIQKQHPNAKNNLFTSTSYNSEIDTLHKPSFKVHCNFSPEVRAEPSFTSGQRANFVKETLVQRKHYAKQQLSKPTIRLKRAFLEACIWIALSRRASQCRVQDCCKLLEAFFSWPRCWNDSVASARAASRCTAVRSAFGAVQQHLNCCASKF